MAWSRGCIRITFGFECNQAAEDFWINLGSAPAELKRYRCGIFPDTNEGCEPGILPNAKLRDKAHLVANTTNAAGVRESQGIYPTLATLLQYLRARVTASRRETLRDPPARRFAMKPIVTIALSIAATLITSGSAFAQDHGVQATVPFSFYVGGNWVPAGTYTIGSDSERSNVFSVTNRDQKIGMFALGLIDPTEPGAKAELIFHEYGNQYFLSEIHYPGCSTKVHLPQSKAEKNAKRYAEEASLQVNNNVLIALK
jgi:hypothetical protein